MRILYLSQYFPPEVGATQTRAFEMASNLVNMGHEVTILTEIPNHPAGIIHPEFRGKIVDRSQLNGIDVIRIWVFASPQKTFFRRMFFYLSYMINAGLAGMTLARGAYDLIYSTSPPLFVGAAGLFLSRIKNVPMVFEVRDLWPESAVELGEISNSQAIALATHLEEACYHRSLKIIAVTDGIRTRLIERGFPHKKILLIPNGANTELFTYQIDARRKIRSKHNFENKFTVIYAGIFGIAQGLETIIQSAELLHDKSEIHFLMIGEGPTKDKIVQLSAQLKLTNMTFLPAVSREEMPAYLSAADVAIIPLRNIPIFKGALPSKMFDAWSCERPIIVCIDGEARRTLEKADSGLFVPPEEPGDLSNAILQIKENPILAKEMGMRGRRFTEENYSRRSLAEQLEHQLMEVLAEFR